MIDGRIGVKTCDRSCSFGQKGLGQCTPCRHPIEKSFFIEPGHFDNSVDERAASVEGQAAVRLAGNPAHGEIYSRRSAPIEFKFPLTEKSRLRGRREINIGQPNCAFKFEGTAANQHDKRNMGFNRDDIRRRLPMGFWDL